MRAEILATGNEVLTGTIVDSNSAFIAAALEETGIEVRRHTCVGDDIELIAAAVREIAGRADVALITGGLGPTGDDLTAEAVARAAGVRLAFDETAGASVRRFFEERGMKMRETDPKQTLLPEGAVCIPNSVGSAPGFSLNVGRCRVYVMPGVPFEMEIMMTASVLPDIVSRQAGGNLHAAGRTLSVFGLPESEVGRLIAGIPERFPGARYGIRVSFPEMFVRISTRDQRKDAAEALVEKAARWTQETIGECVFSGQGLSLPAEVGRLLAEKKKTVAVAESCTGGLVGHLLTNNPGSSDYFLLSAVTYANTAKTAVIGVPQETIDRYGAVSEETARAMAAGVRRLTGADYGLAISGIAGPSGGSTDKPVGTVCIGLAAPEGEFGRTLKLSFQNRSMNKRIFAFAALEMLRRQLR
ncbi:MAG: competence/damage-inducible protein A [Thermodesulfobacteriota bacterium]